MFTYKILVNSIYIIQFNYVLGYLMAGSIVLNPDRSSQSQTNEQLQSNFSANSANTADKDKTPMCLVNELSRFNKVFILISYFH